MNVVSVSINNHPSSFFFLKKWLGFFSCRASPSRLIVCFQPTPPRSRCTTPRPSRLSKVGCDETRHLLSDFGRKCCAALNLFLLFLPRRCSVWIQWHYFRIWTNLLREDSHHGGVKNVFFVVVVQLKCFQKVFYSNSKICEIELFRSIFSMFCYFYSFYKNNSSLYCAFYCFYLT